MNRKNLLITSVVALTAVFAVGAWYFSSDPGDIAQGLWGAFAACVATLVALMHSRE